MFSNKYFFILNVFFVKLEKYDSPSVKVKLKSAEKMAINALFTVEGFVMIFGHLSTPG